MHTEIPIARHGLIGDLQTSALVGDDGTIDWFCSPRFDSPSIFAGLLDHSRGGHFRIAPDGEWTSTQRYLPGTAVLVTRFATAGALGELLDFMPVTSRTATPIHRIVRRVRCLRGHMRWRVDCQPRFDYARQKHSVEISAGGAVFRSHEYDVMIRAAGMEKASCPTTARFEQREDGVTAVIELSEGQSAGVALITDAAGPPRAVSITEIDDLYLETVKFWRVWLDGSRYRGRWRESVERSAITLKLMTYAPTGAFVTAPTTSLPERLGGQRNWDHRYMSIGGSSFAIHALLGMGFMEEAGALAYWVASRVAEAGQNAAPLRVTYGVDGSADAGYEFLPHLSGYHGSSPVRIGNAAPDQLRLDVYGGALDAMYLADAHGIHTGHRGWTNVSRIVDWLCDHWDSPQEGIWDTGNGGQDFVFARFQAWVALDRALRMAQRSARPANAAMWTNERDRVYNQVMMKGWDAGRGAFVRCYGCRDLDASLLLMPVMGFVDPDDPMWLSTLEAIGNELAAGILVYRYNPNTSPEELPGSESTFSVCSFWWVDALARSGFLDEARLGFDKMLTFSNHLGLYSEELSPTGEQIGNFPQAFAHVALINSALNLDYQIDHGSDSVAAVQRA